MEMLCDRCRKASIKFELRHEWLQLAYRTREYGKINYLFLCPNCKDKFYGFLKRGEQE